MPAFGDYQSVGEIEWGEDSTIYSAASLSGQRNKKFAVKVRRFPDTELNAAAFESARLQKATVDFGGKHLAPVFDSGITEDGRAWYVTRHYDSSLAAFLKARSAAHGALLYRITDEILSGLEEFFNTHRRPHGNLKPGNVLLEGSDHATLHAILTDPAAEPGEIDSRRDLFSLGLIVYQLVRRSARVQVVNPPLELTHEWSEFGKPWLDFTNRLLDRSANEGPNAIREVRGHLRKLRKVAPAVVPDPRERIGGFWKIAAAVVLLGGIGGATNYYFDKIRPPPPPPETKPEEMKLAQAVLALCENPPAVLSRDSHLESVFKKLGNAEPNRKLLGDFSAAISADQWPAKKAVNDAYDTYSKAHWDGLRRALDNAHGKFDVWQPPAPQLIVTAKAADSVDWIAAEWQPVKKLFDSWADAHETDMLAFKEWAEGEMKAQESLPAAPEKIRDIRSQLEMVSTRTSTVEWKSHFRQARFHSEFKIADKRLSPREWLVEAEKYWREEDATILNQWKNQKADLDTALPADQREREAKALSDLERRLEDPVVSDAPSIADLLAKLSTHIQPTPVQPVTPPTTIPIPTNNSEVVKSTPAPTLPPGPSEDERALASCLKGILTETKPNTTSETMLASFNRQLSLLKPEQQAKMQGLKSDLEKLVQPLPPNLGSPWVTGEARKAGQSVYYICQYQKAINMTFVRVQQPGETGYFYMAATELGRRLAAATLFKLQLQPDVGDGPQVWSNAGWEWKKVGLNMVQSVIKSKVTFYPEVGGREQQPKPPSDETPATFLSGKKASTIAGALNCNLPTMEQWNAAFTTSRPQERPRLRGKLWNEQLDHWKQYRFRYMAIPNAGQPSGYIPWPDDKSYTAKPGQWDNGGTPEPSPEADNQSLWFRDIPEADAERTGLIYDLEGNVAEFVTSGSEILVVGGSAISEWKDRRTPKPLPFPAQSYSDVGIRLVVAAKADDLIGIRNRLQQELQTLPRELR